MPERWADTKAKFYVQAVADLGMTISQAAATRLIERHVELIASQLGITVQTARRYVDDEALRAVAASEVARHADEAPGACITRLEADRDIPTTVAGEIILALLVAAEQGDDSTPSPIPTESLLQAAAAVAYFLSQSPPGEAQVPRALLRRCGRYLRASAPGVSATADD